MSIRYQTRAALRYGTSLCTVLGLLGAVLMTPALGQIENGDFADWKSESIPAQWSIGILPSTAKEEVVVEAVDEEGTPGIKISNNASKDVEVHLAQGAKNFLPGRKYRLAFEFKKAEWSSGSGRIGFEPGPGIPNLRVLETFGQGEEFIDRWQQIQAEFQIPGDADVSRWLFQIRLIGQGEFYLRKLEVEDVE